jgi:hypothetical protein
MKSSIRTFVLAASAAACFAATTHSASAQLLYANTTNANHVLPYEAMATLNAVILPSAGTYVLSGQQMFIVEGTQQTTVSCWVSTTPGSLAGAVPKGPLVSATVQSGGSYVTLPLNGYYVATGRTEIWVLCEYSAPSTATTVESLPGIIMATSVQN